ncbi:DUF6415 family natural product biosynthesis protein [Streptomyces syringium]|uniref:DUF6415 family natural product biosynthesis protein n=1 Tax=Streptomyces syringium TaxID=76729 RepID=UPI00343C91C7
MSDEHGFLLGPLDSGPIRDTVNEILTCRGLPSPEDTAERLRRLREHAQLLIPAARQRSEGCRNGMPTAYSSILTLGIDLIQRRLDRGCPAPSDHTPDAAHAYVQALARHCASLLGLVADEPMPQHQQHGEPSRGCITPEPGQGCDSSPAPRAKEEDEL